MTQRSAFDLIEERDIDTKELTELVGAKGLTDEGAPVPAETEIAKDVADESIADSVLGA